jgi:hypothetical protein
MAEGSRAYRNADGHLMFEWAVYMDIKCQQCGVVIHRRKGIWAANPSEREALNKNRRCGLHLVVDFKTKGGRYI